MDGFDTHKLPNVLETALPPHHRATRSWRHGRFDNPFPTWEERSFTDAMRWNKHRRQEGIPTDGYLSNNRTPSREDWLAAFPPAEVDWAAIASPPQGAVQVGAPG